MEPKHRISPEEYRKILSGIELLSISLQESKTFLNCDCKYPTDVSANIKDECRFKLYEDGIVNIFQEFQLDARKINSKTRFIQISATFIVKLKSKETFSDDFFEIYKKISLNLNTWPYLREFVNSITSRMNVPPLTLPFFRT
jgi:hypothetical protein